MANFGNGGMFSWGGLGFRGMPSQPSGISMDGGYMPINVDGGQAPQERMNAFNQFNRPGLPSGGPYSSMYSNPYSSMYSNPYSSMYSNPYSSMYSNMNMLANRFGPPQMSMNGSPFMQNGLSGKVGYQGYQGAPGLGAPTTTGGNVDNAQAIRDAEARSGVTMAEIQANPRHPQAWAFMQAMNEAGRNQLMAQPAPEGRYPDGTPMSQGQWQANRAARLRRINGG